MIVTVFIVTVKAVVIGKQMITIPTTITLTITITITLTIPITVTLTIRMIRTAMPQQ